MLIGIQHFLSIQIHILTNSEQQLMSKELNLILIQTEKENIIFTPRYESGSPGQTMNALVNSAMLLIKNLS